MSEDRPINEDRPTEEEQNSRPEEPQRPPVIEQREPRRVAPEIESASSGQGNSQQSTNPIKAAESTSSGQGDSQQSTNLITKEELRLLRNKLRVLKDSIERGQVASALRTGGSRELVRQRERVRQVDDTRNYVATLHAKLKMDEFLLINRSLHTISSLVWQSPPSVQSSLRMEMDTILSHVARLEAKLQTNK